MILDNSVAGYLAMAEFHDLFMDRPWHHLTPQLGVAFGNLGPDAVIVDVGAGSGVGTRCLAGQTPARIVALEPDPVMRSILLARVADAPELAARVSVIAGSVPDQMHLLPSTVHGFVCAHVLGHLSPSERGGLFGWLSAHLAPSAVGLVTVAREDSSTATTLEKDASVVETRQIGQHLYRAIHRGSSESDTYSSRYEVWDDGHLLRSEEFSGTWHPVSSRDLRSELERFGFEVTEVQAGLVAITTGQRARASRSAP